MTDLDLARRAVACKHWRWDKAAGSAILHSGLLNGKPIARLCDMVLGGYSTKDGFSDRDLIQTIHHLHTLIEPVDVLPDFSSPATVGCLLAIVRVAYGDETLCTRSMATVKDGAWTDGPWWVQSTGAHVQICVVSGDTEAAALVAALEAAT